MRINFGNKLEHSDVIGQDAEIIIKGIQDNNYSGIKEIFSTYVKENNPDLETEIENLMENIDGKVVSYDTVSRGPYGRGISENYEWILRSKEGTIGNIKTDAGKIYEIDFALYLDNKKQPDKLGAFMLKIVMQDQLDENGEYVEKIINYDD